LHISALNTLESCFHSASFCLYKDHKKMCFNIFFPWLLSNNHQILTVHYMLIMKDKIEHWITKSAWQMDSSSQVLSELSYCQELSISFCNIYMKGEHNLRSQNILRKKENCHNWWNNTHSANLGHSSWNTVLGRVSTSSN
jgi:hypothetical protein